MWFVSLSLQVVCCLTSVLGLGFDVLLGCDLLCNFSCLCYIVMSLIC